MALTRIRDAPSSIAVGLHQLAGQHRAVEPQVRRRRGDSYLVSPVDGRFIEPSEGISLMHSVTKYAVKQRFGS